jgi:hypothetical protein
MQSSPKLAKPCGAFQHAPPFDTPSPTTPIPAHSDNMKRNAYFVLCLALVPFLKGDDTVVAPDPANLELAHQVIKDVHADKMLDQMAGQMQQIAAQSLKMNSANLTPEQKALAAKVSSQILDLSKDSAKDLLSKMDVIYAQVYSEAELKAMKAFFESPEGASMIQKQPQIMQKFMPYIQAMQRELMPKIQKITSDARAEEQAASAAAIKLPDANAAATPAAPSAAQPAPK